VITSAEKPPLELCEALKLGYVYINTQKAPRRRDWERDDDLDSEDDWLEAMRDKNDATARAMMAVAVSRAAEERARWEMKLEKAKQRALSKTEEKAEEREELEDEEK
jgi:hypothetical protein